MLHRQGAALARRLVKRAARQTQSHGRPSARRAEVTRRTGALAVKVGMVGAWDDAGRRHALTALHLDNCRVVQVKTDASDGYSGLQLGAGLKKAHKATAAARGHARPAYGDGEDALLPATAVPRLLAEFRVSPDALLERGQIIGATHFAAGQKVDVQGVTKGKGFQGPMKRWNFAGQRATHGVSKVHRAHGSMGGCQDPGRVMKGKKMAGRMGGRRRTAQNLVVHAVDAARDLVFVRGAVPGPKGTWVRVSDAVKAVGAAELLGGDVPFPAFRAEAGAEASVN